MDDIQALYNEINSLHVYLVETKVRFDNMEVKVSSQFMDAYTQFLEDEVIPLLESFDG